VAERLRGLLPGSSDGAGQLISRVDRRADGLLVRLQRPDGSPVGERLLRGQHPCDQLADAAAVMIATWVQAGQAPGLQAPAMAPGRLGLQAAPATTAATTAWDLDAALGGSWSADGLVSAAQAGAGADLPGGIFGLRLDALVTGQAETPLGQQAARWRRSSLALSARVRRAGKWLTGELHAGPALAFLQVEGRGFDPAQTRSESDLVFGVGSGARLALFRRGLQPFLAGGLSFWPARSLVYALPAQTAEPLPRLQLSLTLGVSYRR
jgi:hypothetical protein